MKQIEQRGLSSSK